MTAPSTAVQRLQGRGLVAEPGEELDEQEAVVMDALCWMNCTVPVDPFDPDDCTSVAIAVVRALRHSGHLTDASPDVQSPMSRWRAEQ